VESRYAKFPITGVGFRGTPSDMMDGRVERDLSGIGNVAKEKVSVMVPDD
jgi:delta-aminolevulinic acid dehydratase/porphobilinogen synthase